ncbi:TetR/AcrR family transcriptional regulator [Actinocorallia libanotica]|uniref:TetR/AcrR family transcriptional regulator n=1 Tax=Actinocorallia libanotica TaxID=46162 RepID=A0ABP4CA96_9ACTN
MGVTTDGRLLRGEQTRRTILDRALDIASAEGLEGLSIGRLAGDLSLSKSGLFAHFGSKEELQLATVQAAREAFVDQVVRPVAAAAEPGLARLEALLASWLDYVRRRVFPGGCVLYSISAEYDARPGRIRDAVAASHGAWHGHLRDTVREAVARGELDAATDVDQLVFELTSYVWQACGNGVLYDDDVFLDRAREAVSARLRRARPRSA